ncbi:MAG TPA: penicillin acylase family protein [Thermoanaerobaculia bacterium]|jgi:penicillin amidase|nr:penicillin acylase family protein [Thermoanaerobaculia bacterium]
MRRGLLIAAGVLGVLLLLVIAFSLWFWIQMTASLPQLDGRASVPGLSASVEIERDALGMPTIRAANRADAARGLGFLHGQDRFFQMDLMRRQGAGELAELFGPAAIDIDKQHRIHRFRSRAESRLKSLPEAQRQILEAYTQGVNAGLASLGARPPEYLAIRLNPVPWRPEDSLLAVFSMFFALNDESGNRDSNRGLVRDLLPPELVAYLTAAGNEWDAPLQGGPILPPPMPGPEVFDLSHQPPAAVPAKAAAFEPAPRESISSLFAEPAPADRIAEGSNNWALSGAHTADGRGMLANDMHLGIQVPNTWYRASMIWNDAAGRNWRTTGVTLPGTPMVAVGSNGHVAWGFTNSYGDWTDLVELDFDPKNPKVYGTPAGPKPFEHFEETIRVKGRPPVQMTVLETIWGPVIDNDHTQRPRALAWTAHHPEAINIPSLELETAGNVAEAIRAAHRVGIPPQNFTVVDAEGHIGWTIIGAIPRRFGWDGATPVSWGDGSRGWNGWLSDSEVPAIIDPPDGRLWTANNRTTEGEFLAKLGNGGHDLGARARQIRDDLAKLERATPKDFLAIQLDDRALFLDRWRGVELAALTPQALAGNPERAEIRRLLETTWTGKASVDSVAYLAVRNFRSELIDQVFSSITARCKAADPHFDFGQLGQLEGPIWEMVQKRPAHLLDPKFKSWDEQLLAAIDRFPESTARLGPKLADRTWGRRNTSRFQHPISLAIPALGRYLDAPRHGLPGDQNMPRVQNAGFGASERISVSPGAEEKGIFETPIGQSGHPLSPYYMSSHEAWEKGEPTPFLPGKAVHRLTLGPPSGPK